MARNTESTPKYEADEPLRANEDQLGKLKKGETNKDEIENQNRDFGDIMRSTHEKLNKADKILSDEELKAFNEKLALAGMDRGKGSLKEIQKIEKDINETIDASHKLFEGYVGQLDKNKNLFGKDKSRNIDEIDSKKSEFRNSSLEDKQEAAKKLEEEVKGLKGIRDNLIKIIGEGKGAKSYMERFGKMTEDEKLKYIEATKETVADFQKTFDQLKKSDLYDEEELESITVRFHESSPEQQAKMLGEIKEDLKTENVKYVQENFKKFAPDRQKKYAAQLKKARGLAAKKEVIDAMKDEIRKEHSEKSNASKLASPEEKNESAKYMGEQQDPAMLEMALAFIPKAEAETKKLEDKFTTFPAKIQAKYDFYLARFTKEGTNQKEPGKKEIVAECEKHMELMKKWDDKLKQFQGNKLLSEGSAAKYGEMFQQLSIKEKESILNKSMLDDTKRERTENVVAYEKLKQENPKMMEQHKEFYNLRLEDRVALVENIQAEIKERKEATEAYEKDVDDKVEQRLLSPKSAKAYKDWFKGLGSVDEMKKMLANSDLDDPRREKVRDVFEKEIPEDIRDKHAAIFYNQDLTGRIQTLRTLLPDGGKSLDMALNDMGEAKMQLDELQQKTELKIKLQDASKFEQQKNYRAEYEIRKDIASLEPENEMNQERLQMLELSYGSGATADMAADHMIHGAMTSSTMKDRVEASAIFLRMAGSIKQQEDLTQHRSFEDRSMLRGSTEDRQLSEDFNEFTDGEMYIDATTGKAKKTMTFKMQDFQNLNKDGIQAQKRMMREESQIQDVTQRGKRQDIVDRDGKHLESKKLEETADHLIEELTMSIMASQADSKLDGEAMKQAIAKVMKRRITNENVVRLQDAA